MYLKTLYCRRYLLPNLFYCEVANVAKSYPELLGLKGSTIQVGQRHFSFVLF